MVTIDLSKQKALDANPKSIQQFNFTWNLKQKATIFFIYEEGKQNFLDFSQGTVKVFKFHFLF